MNMLKNTWYGLSPQKKRYFVIGCGAAAIAAAVSVTGSEGESISEKRLRLQSEEVKQSILTDSNTREIGIDAISAKLKNMESEMNRLQRDNDKLRAEMQSEKARSNQPQERLENMADNLNDEVIKLTQDKKDLESRLKQLEEAVATGNVIELNGAKAEKGANGKSAKGENGQFVPNSEMEQQDVEETVDWTEIDHPEADALNLFQDLGDRPEPVDYSQTEYDYSNKGAKAKRGEEMPVEPVKKLQVIGQEFTEEEIAALNEEEGGSDGLYLPVGSIISGVLINGMDAATGSNASSTPYPSLVRIQAEAILPNYYTQDVRECFLMVGGYGDLSSERALLRTSDISCIKEDGGIIESAIKGYAVGEDGKTGIRGRKVTKQADMILNSMIAGGMSAFSNAFEMQQVPTLASADGYVQLESLMTPEMMQTASVSGVSTAFDRLAEFYIDMAESMLPVIEIDAGRNVQFMLTSGVSLKPKGNINEQ